MPLEDRILHLSLQKIQSAEDGQTRLNQRDKLLIKKDEILRLDLSPPFAPAQRTGPPARPDGNGQQSLLLQVMAHLLSRLPDLDGFHHLAGRLGVLANKFHVCLLSEALNELHSWRRLEFKETGRQTSIRADIREGEFGPGTVLVC